MGTRRTGGRRSYRPHLHINGLKTEREMAAFLFLKDKNGGDVPPPALAGYSSLWWFLSAFLIPITTLVQFGKRPACSVAGGCVDLTSAFCPEPAGLSGCRLGS